MAVLPPALRWPDAALTEWFGLVVVLGEVKKRIFSRPGRNAVSSNVLCVGQIGSVTCVFRVPSWIFCTVAPNAQLRAFGILGDERSQGICHKVWYLLPEVRCTRQSNGVPCS